MVNEIAAHMSLAEQIAVIEQRIAARHYALKVRTSRLDNTIRRCLTSPKALLITIGVGFLLGSLGNRRLPNVRSLLKTLLLHTLKAFPFLARVTNWL
jgi:hypothetical protein